MIKAFFAWLASLFSPTPKQIIAPTKLTKLKQGDTGPLVEYATVLLKRHGQWQEAPVSIFDSHVRNAVTLFQMNNNLTIDGVIGTKETWPALQREPKQAEAPTLPGGARKPPPWYTFAKKFSGKKESDPEFRKIMEPQGKKLVGLSWGNMTSSTWAWCGLAMAVALAGGGIANQDGSVLQGGALAAKWRSYGSAIDWKKNGIPLGAIVQIEHETVCDTDDNHVAQSDGDCTAADLLKPGATINLYGGNQGNAWKVSTYSVKEICAVRWPLEKFYAFPDPVTKSINCSGSAVKESTR